MPEQLPYLQPKLFTIEHKGFLYEIVACHEYYPEFSDPENPSADIDFTGNYLITILTPRGSFQTVLDRTGEDPFEEAPDMDVELYQKIIQALS